MSAPEFAKNIRDTAYRLAFQQSFEKAFQQGFEEGFKEGRQQTVVQVSSLKLGRPVSDDERVVLRERFDTIGSDRLGAVLLQLPSDALAAWLADPNAR